MTFLQLMRLTELMKCFDDRLSVTMSVRVAKEHREDSLEDEASILRKKRRLTDYYDVHKEIGR